MSDDQILGGHKGLIDDNPRHGRGVYASHPAQTPKYHTGNNTESVRRQARMIIQFPDRETFAKYRQKVPERARPLLEVLSPQSATGGVGYFDFLLQQVNESYQEKFQVSEVLSGGHIAYFFGQQAPMWSLSGALLNTRQDPWYDAFHILYADVIRGTKMAQHRLPLRLRYDNREVIGSLVACNTMLNATDETVVRLQLQFLVQRVYIRQYRDIRPTVFGGSYDSDNDVFDRAERTYTEVYASVERAREAEALETRIREEVEAEEAEEFQLDPHLQFEHQQGPHSTLA